MKLKGVLPEEHNQVIGAKIHYTRCKYGSSKWDKVFKNGSNKICGRKSLSLSETWGNIVCLCLIGLDKSLNTLSQMMICMRKALFYSFLLFIYFQEFDLINFTICLYSCIS